MGLHVGPHHTHCLIRARVGVCAQRVVEGRWVSTCARVCALSILHVKVYASAFFVLVSMCGFVSAVCACDSIT